MIDTHAHLDFPEFDKDRDEVITRFFSQGGKAIINIGINLERSRKSVEIAEKHKNIYAAVGFHPNEAGENNRIPSENEFQELKKLARHKNVRAIGEIGLDYFYSKSDEQIKLQKELFEKQIDIAKELSLPIVIHCRDAWNDLYEIISGFYQSSAFPFRPDVASGRNSSKPSFTNFVLHCYSGGREDTEKFLKLPNVWFSFSGNITYPKPAEKAEKLAEIIRLIPIERIMLDSDSPFLAPQEMRGKRNEPIFVKYIAKRIAEIKNIKPEEAEEQTDSNAIEFFTLNKEKVD